MTFIRIFVCSSLFLACTPAQRDWRNNTQVSLTARNSAKDPVKEPRFTGAVEYHAPIYEGLKFKTQVRKRTDQTGTEYFYGLSYTVKPFKKR